MNRFVVPAAASIVVLFAASFAYRTQIAAAVRTIRMHVGGCP